MPKIDISKSYSTREGTPARILCVDRPDADFPVVALLGNYIECFTAEGHYDCDGNERNLDLIETTIKTSYYTVYANASTGVRCDSTQKARDSQSLEDNPRAIIQINVVNGRVDLRVVEHTDPRK